MFFTWSKIVSELSVFESEAVLQEKIKYFRIQSNNGELLYRK